MCEEQPIPEGAKTRIAMQLGAAMGEANRELTRPSFGEELAARAGLAARAAALAFVDMANPESPGMYVPVTGMIAQQAYGAEWMRLQQRPREEWHQ